MLVGCDRRESRSHNSGLPASQQALFPYWCRLPREALVSAVLMAVVVSAGTLQLTAWKALALGAAEVDQVLKVDSASIFWTGARFVTKRRYWAVGPTERDPPLHTSRVARQHAHSLREHRGNTAPVHTIRRSQLPQPPGT
jgi:hypothetical protein